MTAKQLITFTAAALTSAWLVQASAEKIPPTAPYDPQLLAAVCRLAGGVFSPPGDSPGGGFYCLFPDGTLISCGSDNNCSVSTRIASLDDLWQRVFLVSRVILDKVASGPADLVPVLLPASSAPYGYCKRNNQGQLLIDVYNQGGVDAAASTTRIIFDNTSALDLATPAIAAGTRAQLVVSIPNACFGANNECRFTMGVDALGVVAESSETNNNATGACGPQFQ